MAIMALPHTMSIERLGTSGANKEAYTSRPDIKCFLQPAMDADGDTGSGSAFAKASRCFVDYAANVKVKDRVQIDGVKYNVSGETSHQYGSWPHRVLTLQAI